MTYNNEKILLTCGIYDNKNWFIFENDQELINFAKENYGFVYEKYDLEKAISCFGGDPIDDKEDYPQGFLDILERHEHVYEVGKADGILNYFCEDDLPDIAQEALYTIVENILDWEYIENFQQLNNFFEQRDSRFSLFIEDIKDWFDLEKK